LFLGFFSEEEAGGPIGSFARVFEGGFEKSRVFAWCFAGEFVVN